MARARNIKPSFFLNDELIELCFAARLLFIGLWTLADREGLLEDRPKRIKMSLFPADTVDVDVLLADLAAAGFVERYVVDGVRYLHIVKFHKHQNPHLKEAQSVIPKPNLEDVVTQEDPSNAPVLHQTAPADSLIPDSLNSDSLIHDSQERDSKRQDSLSHVALKRDVNNQGLNPDLNVAFETFWDLYDKKVQPKTCEKKWRALCDRERELVMAHVLQYKVAQPDKAFRKNPETYLNQKSWHDEVIRAKGIGQQVSPRPVRRAAQSAWDQYFSGSDAGIGTEGYFEGRIDGRVINLAVSDVARRGVSDTAHDVGHVSSAHSALIDVTPQVWAYGGNHVYV